MVDTNLLQTSTTTVVTDVSALTLDSVVVEDTAITLTGQVGIQNPILIRYWINGKWYTYGVYQGL